MNNIQPRNIAIFAALAALMLATRFNHFGSAFSLPDASYAVFFLGGLYLAKLTRASAIAFIALIVEAGMIDFYATSVQGISDWCMTTAYWFLIPTYGSLWLAGTWFASRRALQGRDVIGLAVTAWTASSFAFVFSNATFYAFSGRFADMGAVEYASRVAQYYAPYVSVAMLYIACAIALHIAADILVRQRAHTH